MPAHASPSCIQSPPASIMQVSDAALGQCPPPKAGLPPAGHCRAHMLDSAGSDLLGCQRGGGDRRVLRSRLQPKRADLHQHGGAAWPMPPLLCRHPIDETGPPLRCGEALDLAVLGATTDNTQILSGLPFTEMHSHARNGRAAGSVSPLFVVTNVTVCEAPNFARMYCNHRSNARII